MIFFVMSLLLALFDNNKLLTSESDGINLNKLAFANNELAFKLHKTLSVHGNVFSSPASIFTALGMLYIGARGVTAEEIRHALSYDTAGLNDETINKNFHKLLLSFGNNSNDCKLEIANAIVSHEKYSVLNEYKKALKKYYGTIVKEVDFETKTAEALQKINSWVNNKTQGRIPTLLESLDSDTVLLLLNAVYFKGNWKLPFLPMLTEKGKFYNDGINTVTVPFMIQEGHFFYGKFPEYGMETLKMFYKGDKVSMIVLLPLQRNGVRRIEERLTPFMLEDTITRLQYKNVVIKFPKFKLEDSIELKQNFAILGMKSAFTNAANFGGINKEANLKVSKIVHKAMVIVNEEGTEASGATAVMASPRMLEETNYFFVEYPFLFFIMDNETKMILFSGRVNVL